MQVRALPKSFMQPSPVAPVLLCRSLPARSTRLSLPTRIWPSCAMKTAQSSSATAHNVTCRQASTSEAHRGWALLYGLNGDGEHRVGAGAVLVHHCGTDRAVLLANLRPTDRVRGGATSAALGELVWQVQSLASLRPAPHWPPCHGRHVQAPFLQRRI